MRLPILLVTVYRRYFELRHNLARLRALALAEFGYHPSVVVVWAAPEVGHYWFFQELLRSGVVNHVVGRPASAEEGGATTGPESLNLRAGLEFVRRTWGEDVYAVGLAADVCPQAGAFRFLRDAMAPEAAQAVVCHWESTGGADCWHTNFFAVGMDAAYWPPVARNSPASLEAVWGHQLATRRLPGVVKTHNARRRFFTHTHESDGHPPWPRRPQTFGLALSLLTRGGRTWGAWLRGVFTRRR